MHIICDYIDFPDHSQPHDIFDGCRNVCCIFVCPNNSMTANVPEIFDVCANVDTYKRHNIREYALKVDYGRRIPCRTKESDGPTSAACQMLQQLSFIPRRMCFRCC